MKKSIAVLMAAAIILGLTGCDFLFSGSYVSVTPHQLANSPALDANTDITSYGQLRDKLCDMVATGTEELVLYFPDTQASVLATYMRDAIAHLKNVDPIGAYAVGEITYEVGNNAGRQATAIRIRYVHSRAEILQIQKVNGMNNAGKRIAGALEACNAGVVLHISNYEAMDFTQFVQDYVDSNPDQCMEMPQVAVTVYPEQGTDRVVELSFAYQTSRDALRMMQQRVAPVFASAELYVAGDGDVWQKYFQLYSFLMERYDYTLETSITPSYSLLQHGVGDSKAFATVYATMCRKAGLDCQVVSGTRSGAAWYWNVIHSEGEFYYVDLLRCNQNGRFRVHTQNEMSGYVWDYSQYQKAS